MARGNKEPAFAENPEFFKEAFENAPDAFYMIDLKGNFIYANDAAERMIGYKRGYLIGKNFRNAGILSKESMGTAVSAMLKSIAGKPTGPDEYVLIRKDGSKMHVQIVTRPIKFGGKAVVMGTVRDITERKKAEAELNESRKKYQSLIETTNDFIWEMDWRGRYTYCSPQMWKLWGIKPKEMIGKTPFDRIPASQKSIAAKSFSMLAKSPQPFSGLETVSTDGRGRLIHLETSGVPFFSGDGKLLGFRGISRDVTERRKIDDALKESEKKYRALVESAADQIFLLDGSLRFISLNSSVAKLLGRPANEMVGKPISSAFPKETFVRFSKNCREVFRTGKAKSIEEKMTINGKDFYSSTVLSPVKDDKGNVSSIMGVVRDVTDRRNAEEALKQSEQRYRVQFEDAMDAIFIADAETGILLDCNQAAADLMERRKSEIIGHHQKMLHPPGKGDGRFSETFKRHLAESGKVIDTQVITKSGKIKDVAIKANTIEIGGKKILQGIFRDVTQLKKAAEELSKSERKYRDMVDGAPVGVYKTNVKGDILFANKSLASTLGYASPQELMKRSIVSVYKNPDDRKSLLKELKRTGSVSGFEVEYITKTGGLRCILLNATLNGEIISGMMLDITDRKKAEHEIKESEERFKELFDNMDECVAVYEVKDGGNEIIIKDFNKAAERLEKVLRKDIIGKRVDVAFKGVKELGLFDAFKKVWKTGKSINHPVSFYKDEYHSGWRENFIFKLPSGEVVAIYSDVTESKKAEETLKESEEKYRSIVDNIGIGVAMIDGNMKIMSLNTQMSKWFPKADVSVKPFCYKCFNDPPRKEICTWCPTCKTLQDGQVHESVTNTPSGSAVRHFRIVSSPIKENGKITAAIEMVEDITDKLNADEDIRKRNEELEKLNRLAVGRELRMVELKKRIAELEQKEKGKVLT